MKSKQHIQRITPEKAQEILLKNGVQVPLSKAAMVLDFMYKMAILDKENLERK